MTIIFLHRPNATAGGDFVALNGYTNALKEAGVTVELRSADNPGDLTTADYVHLWAACSPDWGLRAAHETKRQGARLIITPFWWSRAERQAFYGKPGQDLVPGYTEAVAHTLRLADVLFPVTMSEAQQCWLLAPRARVHIVPMGVDRPQIEQQPAEDYVLCIGRIEPHKNQFSLTKACEMLGVQLSFVGAKGDKRYADYIINEYAHVSWFGNVTDGVKYDLLSRARVHALPSFFENPGLVHGEAALLGVPSVMGNRGAEAEHWGAGGIYCDPTSVDDIAAAINEAWRRPRGQWAHVPTWEESAWYALQWLGGNRIKSERAVEIPWMLGKASGAKCILDVGSAGAKYLPSLALKGESVTAIDTRPFNVPVGISGYQLDARYMPVEWAGRFDVVTCVSVLDHVGLDAYGNTEDEQALPAVANELGRVTAKGGRLLVTVPVGKPQLTTHPNGGQRVFALDEITNLFTADLWRVVSQTFWKRDGDDYMQATADEIANADYNGWRADAAGAWEFERR